MLKKPEYLTRADVARLIPVVSDTSKEQRTTSILLAAFRGVYQFRKVMLGTIDMRVGSRTELQAWTEVGFPKEDQMPKGDRPDGIIVVDTGRKKWTALIEAKVGNAEIGDEQLKNYIALARKYKIDAVITISNQFVAMPTHHPVRVPKSLVKGVGLFHWSWMYVVTQATLLLEQGAIENPQERFILEEVRRHLSHANSGISRFDSMNREWKEVCNKVKSGAVLNKSSEDIINTVSSWHQEQRDLCLVMSRKLSQNLKLKLPRNHSVDPALRLKDDAELLAKNKILKCVIEVPNAAADIEVVADLSKRTIISSIRLSAPQDKKSTSARVNWLVRQLSKSETNNIYVKACRPGRAEESQAPLSEVLMNVNVLESPTTKVVPTAFEIFHMADIAGRFCGSKTFIEELERAVPLFYEQVGQRLRAWVAPPPKMSKIDPAEDTSDEVDNTQSTDSENSNKDVVERKVDIDVPGQATLISPEDTEFVIKSYQDAVGAEVTGVAEEVKD